MEESEDEDTGCIVEYTPNGMWVTGDRSGKRRFHLINFDDIITFERITFDDLRDKSRGA